MHTQGRGSFKETKHLEPLVENGIGFVQFLRDALIFQQCAVRVGQHGGSQ